MARRSSAGITIGDVAREAGVSISTVSRIVNGEFGAAAEETRARIFAAIDRDLLRESPGLRLPPYLLELHRRGQHRRELLCLEER